MTRLRHSPRGYLRYMQMSRYQIFAFVEGRTDPYFYSKICESVCNPNGISYEVCRAQELPQAAGGKQALLSYFQYLRRRSSLLDTFKGKYTGAIFFLDKDVDDLMRIQKRSSHLIYTEYYDAENYIFKYGDLIEAMAAAACLDRLWLQSQVVDSEIWRKDLAERWKEWLKLCLFAKLKKIRGNVNYGSTSQINNPLYATVNETEYAARLADLQARSGLSNSQFHRAFKRLSRFVDSLYVSDEYDRIFKGKWYASLLDADIKNIAGTIPINSNGLPSRLVQVLSITLNFEQRWAEHFKQPLRDIMSRL
jgi:hypothetical protein